MGVFRPRRRLAKRVDIKTEGSEVNRHINPQEHQTVIGVDKTVGPRRGSKPPGRDISIKRR